MTNDQWDGGRGGGTPTIRSSGGGGLEVQAEVEGSEFAEHEGGGGEEFFEFGPGGVAWEAIARGDTVVTIVHVDGPRAVGVGRVVLDDRAVEVVARQAGAEPGAGDE